MNHRVGDVVGGYRLEVHLGRGSAGDTFAARHLVSEAQVAIKFVPAASPEIVERFKAEYQAVAGIESPGLARILAFESDVEGAYLVRELVQGKSVEEWLTALGTLNECDAIAVAISISHGLIALHRHGVIHRDIKPANVIVPAHSDGSPTFQSAKLTDLETFGRLEQTHRGAHTTLAGQVFGTPVYMSPEQAMGKPQGPAADVYGTGTLLFEMLFGRPPFAGGNFTELLLQIFSKPVEVPDSPAIRPATRALLLRCLSKAPAQRFVDGAALHAALLGLSDQYGAGTSAISKSSSSATPTHDEPVRPTLAPVGSSATSRWWFLVPVGILALGGACVALRSLSQALLLALAVGVALIAASVASGVILYGWIDQKRSALQPAVGALLGRTSNAAELRKSIAVDLEELIARCSKLDQRIMAQSVAFMMSEVERAKKSTDRQDAVMKAIALLEKLMDKLSPWYVRQQKTISWGISLVGSLAGVAKVMTAIVSARSGH